MKMSMSMIGRSTATSSAFAANSGRSTPASMQSRPCMASDTVSTNSDEDADLALSWSGRWTLAHRILAMNGLTLVLVALSTLYLDVFRNKLSSERSRQIRIEATATAEALSYVRQGQWPAVIADLSTAPGSRVRLYGPDGRRIADSWQLTGPAYQLVDPSTQGWETDDAGALDRGFNAIVGARR